VPATLALLAPMQASAAKTQPQLDVISTDVFAPFNIDVKPHGIYVADGGTETVSLLRFDGTMIPLVTDATGTSGVAKNRSRLAYTTTVTDPDTFENTDAALNIRGSRGTVVADTHDYEVANNPDQVNSYGIENATQCQIDAVGPPYTGAIDSHAYSVAAWGNKWLLADAGANDILAIDNAGNISTVAVLPPQPHTVTAEEAEALELPDCMIGATYSFEPVPTDVEVGKNGMLYVTTLPGGPEGPALGARGSVYKVNPWNGHVSLVATGFLGATNLALGNNGKIYVAELFGDQISVVDCSQVKPYVHLTGAVAVERGLRHGNLIAGTLDPTFQGPGSIVRIRPGDKAKSTVSLL
jgi:hypothetical protein